MSKLVEILIITGLSGAGKTAAMQSLEDIGYFCVDNLPPALIPKFVEMAKQSTDSLRKVALACDLRGGSLFQPLVNTVRELRKDSGVTTTVIYLEASDETLVRRFKETRRRHPFLESQGLLEAITEERRALEQVRDEADILLDTTSWKQTRLKRELVHRFTSSADALPIHVISFGFKYGVPIDADMIFDVRFLPNPHYVAELQPYTGEDEPVYKYVMECEATQVFLKHLEDMVDFLIPEFTKEGKSHLVVGVGCTGGKHRSVAIAKHLKEHIDSEADVYLTHRDYKREG
ncbi:RNase adapter RapZ [Alicyclobacillus sp. SO9]|uniref:RNase adapter RapZ n=1 Tax=Alicyclobacillus sp. SO9 TaxID=2665646 RepID=UPI0018E76757|nr:RNase adapter RapZ [Alicyclobacillus sp. SO9]QQE79468.1 RNase adapter RapZ [Alicyclobacillus sp. SO9]